MTTEIGTAVTYGIVRMETALTAHPGAIENGQVSMRVSDSKTTITDIVMLDTEEGARQFNHLKEFESLVTIRWDQGATAPHPSGPPPVAVERLDDWPSADELMKDLVDPRGHTREESVERESEPAEPDESVDETAPELGGASSSASPATPPTTSEKPMSWRQAQAAEQAETNERVREYLKQGLTVTQIAKKEGVSHAAISQRIRRHGLRDGIAEPQSSATAVEDEDQDDVDEDDTADSDDEDDAPADDEDEDLGPESGPPEVVHATRKPNPLMDKLVPAFGAQRRIRALFAIGYDPTGLNVKLLGDHITVADILNAQPSKKGGVPEIRQGDWLAINELYERHKLWDRTPNPIATVNRSAPPPSAWANIDDPNENH